MTQTHVDDKCHKAYRLSFVNLGYKLQSSTLNKAGKIK